MQKTDRNIRDSYKQYKEEIKNIVDIKTYIKIANLYNKFLMKHVLEGDEVTLPARLGTIIVYGTKQKIRFDLEGNPILPPNYVKTKELWEKCPDCKRRKQFVYHTNEHSDGIRYKFLWSKKRVLVSNKTLYSLRFTRANKRELSSKIKNGKEYYITKR